MPPLDLHEVALDIGFIQLKQCTSPEAIERLHRLLVEYRSQLVHIKTLETAIVTGAEIADIANKVLAEAEGGPDHKLAILANYGDRALTRWRHLRAALSTTDAQPQADIRAQIEQRWASVPDGDSDFSAIERSGSPQPDPRDDRIKELHTVLQLAANHLDYCNYGDKWERECADAQNLPIKIAKALG